MPIIIGVSGYAYDHVKDKLKDAGFKDGYFESPLTIENINDVTDKLKDR